ncbi:S-adenosylmethionine decarboxylase proenzyme-like [Limulus polyphemus]|uniref:S-adenosylmethionine decarboxylase proenzyme n=1 Tax=Limulus polyphemus TaxID=6850 RepID=A0ABM1BY61_LIMPO|nr:S-adenosylmethionine decarboxylase proenzyme-like [Limulus polyphemus]
MNVEDNYCGFFEGTEKLLEMWFSCSDGDMEDCDVRKIPRAALESLLKLVKCEIISFKKNEQIDAYVLSESSMFVSKSRFILKTCGSTTLLRAVQPLLYLVQEYTGFDEVLDIFYSRKNFIRPELQLQPHTSFEDEVGVLDGLFEDGAAYCLGRVNQDCWYLYTLNPPDNFVGVQAPDQTLEVIMQQLDSKIMRIFTKKVCSTAQEATHRSGIDMLFPGIVIDDFLFDPCGYSMNGLLKGGYYITIHITPEPHCSYVSFETNAPQESYQDLILGLMKTFNPGKFTMTVFANKASVAANAPSECQECHFKNYQRKELQLCEFKNYNLTYALFAKAPS